MRRGRRSSQGAVVHRPASIYLSDEDLAQSSQRIGQCMDVLSRDGTRITEKLDFEVTRSAAARSGRS
jgi:hypothetical protein